MNFYWKPLIKIFALIVCYCAQNSFSSQDSVRLYKHLFENENYTRMVRPVLDDEVPLHVKVNFLLRGISDFNEVAGQVSIALAVDLRWRDESLNWNPLEYKVRTLVLPEDQIWLPRLSLANPTDRIILFEEDSFDVRIYPTGDIIWLQGGTIHATCSPNVQKYPFDIHVCNITVLPLNYIHTEVVLHPEVNISHFDNFGEWELGSYKASPETFYLFSSTVLTLEIRRRPEFSVLSIIIPILFLGVLNACVFLLPAESGERVSYGITVLLSFAVFLTIISSMMPKNSEPVPILCYILTIMMASSGVIMLCVILGLRWFYRDPDIPVPRCLAILCCRRRKDNHKKENTDVSEQLSNMLCNHSPRFQGYGKQNSSRNVTWKDLTRALDICMFFSFLVLFAALVGVYLMLVYY